MAGARRYTKRDKVLIGGLGALTPLVLPLLSVDLQNWWENLTVFVLLGAMLRISALCYLGGIVAFLHKDENSPIKLFELGIVAPALITGLLHGIPAGHELSQASQSGFVGAAGLFVTPAFAQELNKERPAKSFRPPKETVVQQIWRGVIDSQVERVWFVIAGSYPTLEQATLHTRQINSAAGSFHAEIYAPYKPGGGYSVVIGANLTLAEARDLSSRASRSGLPQVYIWEYQPNGEN